jgi:hypothetical protein
MTEETVFRSVVLFSRAYTRVSATQINGLRKKRDRILEAPFSWLAERSPGETLTEATVHQSGGCQPIIILKLPVAAAPDVIKVRGENGYAGFDGQYG